MHLTTVFALASSLSLSSLLPLASAQLITADNHSFGGVNYPLLQYFTPKHRDETIRAIVGSNARVIRLFIRPDSHHTDPEPQLGEFDKSLLDQLDDTLAAIHRISNGTVKVIIAPHDAHALRGTNDVPCDAYCDKINGAFLDFYSNEDIRKIYKTRLDVFFKHYPSKNFGGRSWSELSEVIMVCMGFLPSLSAIKGTHNVNTLRASTFRTNPSAASGPFQLANPGSATWLRI